MKNKEHNYIDYSDEIFSDDDLVVQGGTLDWGVYYRRTNCSKKHLPKSNFLYTCAGFPNFVPFRISKRKQQDFIKNHKKRYTRSHIETAFPLDNLETVHIYCNLQREPTFAGDFDLDVDPCILLGDILNYNFEVNNYIVPDNRLIAWYDDNEEFRPYKRSLPFARIKTDKDENYYRTISSENFTTKDFLDRFLCSWKEFDYEDFKILCFIFDYVELVTKKTKFTDEINSFQIFDLFEMFANSSEIKIPTYHLETIPTDYMHSIGFTIKGQHITNYKSVFYNMLDEIYNDKLESSASYEDGDEKNETLCKYYQLDSLSELMLALLYETVRNNRIIKKCEQCGKLFSPSKSDSKYCTRAYDGKSCSQIAKAKNRKPLDEVGKKYNSKCTNLSNKMNRKNITAAETEAYRKTLYTLRDEYPAMKKKLKKGEITEIQLIEWLDTFDKK
ncbi:MAG: DUF6076 domain-containing protein [Ruminococcus sp.]|nr:DUF6076 domain-containing protein [Ruminococcus sp.]